MGRALVRTKVWPAPVQSCTHAFSVASPQCHIFSCIVNYLLNRRGVGIRLALERGQSRKYTPSRCRTATDLQCATELTECLFCSRAPPALRSRPDCDPTS
jgi:hypothetical protein